MHRWLFCGWLLAAMAWAQPAWVADLLQPKDLPELCKNVYDATLAGQNPSTPFSSYTLRGTNVTFQTPRGSAYSVCASRARAKEAVPTSFAPLSLAFIYGEVPQLSQLQNWAAAMVLFDATGNEIARLLPNTQVAAPFNPANWSAQCSGNPCVYKGFNLYYFLPTAEFVAKLSEATSYGFLVVRGSNAERFRINKDNAPNLR